ncbi:MAG TPA: histone deacetylase [Candidatus Paceibacterota bacterium]|nr:histone deacetylase [Verrucomicrobiota bacterium]HOX01964.1 histone deacetylase [Verrucomicrobiota bacterium]HRZ43993.1 histone deacetylase [Candidatus Paceibacterota bacterium]HRZ94326.1 histone deacetylase [Candidatus Paceibacterota bacterium]
MIVVTHESCCDYRTPGHPDKPARVRRAITRLRAEPEGSLGWETASLASVAQAARAHQASMLARLEEPAPFDPDTPSHPDIQRHALQAAGGAILAMRCALAGQPAFSLLRPPGHHATPERSMGFCYLNNLAIAVLEALASSVAKVAVLDFDVHHGNGTEEIMFERPGCLFCSVHEFPGYPGTGCQSRGNCLNFPQAHRTPRATYRRALEDALDRIAEFDPALIAVSAGFDAYRGDPLGHQLLEAEDFFWLGSSLRQIRRPFFSSLEGGYSADLPDLIRHYLAGCAGWPVPREADPPSDPRSEMGT